MILKRLKNLWALSAYEPATTSHAYEATNITALKKTITTVEPRPATIVDLEAKDPFDDTN